MTQNVSTSGSASPSGHLPRGKACMNCSRTQQLEETIKKLQNRIGELEAPMIDAQLSVFLHEPYADVIDVPVMALDIPQYNNAWAPPSSASPSSRVTTPTSASSSSGLVLEEPPLEVIEPLVDAFLENFTQVGFFLDATSFRRSALLPLPFGHYDRPSPALLSAVYMWGSRFSRTSRHSLYNEHSFLVCMLQNIHQDLGGQHPHRVIHSIQAEVLLSLYYLTLGRPVEGIYHSSAAVSLAISSELHLIRSSHLIQPYFGVLVTAFPPPVDALEEGERINAFWMVLIVNNYGVAAHGSPSAISYDTPIDTPWPLNLEDYNSQLLDSIVGGGTVSKFLNGLSVDGFSATALLAKASILLERAITFSSRYSDLTDTKALNFLDGLLEQFRIDLPLGLEFHEGSLEKRSLLVTETLSHAAIIRLHAPLIRTSEVSRGKYLSAARSVVHMIRTANLSEWRHIDPIIGILWTTVSEVFISELSTMQSYVGKLTQQHQDISACLETVISAMKLFSDASPLIEQSYTAVTI
ncbi:hypothetical protein B0H10DRAFT_2196467 [Mycena sp. CBHHK59/15]|nr:hypothetical protein B0H10DRAFT_2196467 [Mycena sp. CBHHK59/15]